MDHRDIDITEDINFSRKVWFFERLGWILVALIPFASVIGVLAPAPMSRTVAHTSDGDLKVEYQKFIHYQTPMSLDIVLRKKPPYQRRTGLVVGQEYLRAFKVEQVIPEPLSMRRTKEAIIFTFPVSAEEESISVTLELEPKKTGRVEGSIGSGEGQKITIRQFIWF